jgi:hypothetical protein
MAARNQAKLRLDLSASILSKGAARAEVTPLGRISRTWNIALEKNSLSLTLERRIRDRNR